MKRLFALLIALCMVFTLCACGADSTAGTSAAVTSAAGTTAATTAGTASGTAEGPAPDFGKEPVTLVVPFAAGGQTDLVARAVAQAVEEVTGWTVVVENVTGAGGMTGAAEAAFAEADGYTWLASSIGLVTCPLLGTAPEGVGWDKFENVYMFCSNPGCITVPANSPYKTIDDFIAAAKASPESISIANGGAGGSYHLMALGVQSQAGCKFLHVPYSDGTSAAVVACVGGHVDAVVSSPGEVAAQVEAGNLRILAVASDERYSAFPDVPTFKESGIDVSMATFTGISLPAGTPQEICDAVEDACAKAGGQESFTKFMNENSYGIDLRDSEAFNAMLAAQNDVYSEVVGLIAG